MRGRMGLLGAAASLAISLGSFGQVKQGTSRVTSDSKRGRQMQTVKTKHIRSKYTPHFGAKQKARVEFQRAIKPRGMTLRQFRELHGI